MPSRNINKNQLESSSENNYTKSEIQKPSSILKINMENLTPEMAEARAKLREKFGDTKQLGGKGTARRKAKKVHKSTIGDDKKLQLTIKRLGASQIPNIEEVIISKDDDTCIVFSKPKVQASPQANLYVVSGNYVEKDISQVLPNLWKAAAAASGNSNIPLESAINPEVLRQFQEKVSSMGIDIETAEKAIKQNLLKNTNKQANSSCADDDDVPELVENFEDVSKK